MNTVPYTLDGVRWGIRMNYAELRDAKLDDNGNAVDFAINEKCAPGAGAFIEAMARALETPLGEMGPLALR